MRERRLFYATVVSALGVVMVHLGSPVACSTTVKSVELRPVFRPLVAGQQGELVLAKEFKPVLTSTALTDARALVMMPVGPQGTIQRGELIALDRLERDPWPVTGAFVAYDPERDMVLLWSEDQKVVAVPFDEVKKVTVLGEDPTPAYVGNGLLIGGLIGPLIGGLAGYYGGGGGSSSGSSLGATCGAIAGTGAGLAAGATAGAIVGGAISPGRARESYPIGPDAYKVAPAGDPTQPKARKALPPPSEDL